MRRIIAALFAAVLLTGCSSPTSPTASSTATSVTVTLVSTTTVAGDAAGFTYAVQIAVGESARSLSINWGDGQTQSVSISTAQATTAPEKFTGSITHTFTSRGSFSVTMTLVDSTGASTQSSSVVNVT